MNYTELAAKHEAELNRPDKTAMTQQWIEDAYRDIMSRWKFTWMRALADLTTVVDQYCYSLPTDFCSSNKLTFINGTTDSWAMSLYDELNFNLLHPNVPEDTAGKPEDACITSNVTSGYAPYSELLVWPKPDAATYTLRISYEVLSPALSGTLTPIIPSRYHSTIIFGSLQRGFLHLREYDAATIWGNMYEKNIGKIIAEDNYQPYRNTVMQPFTGASPTYPPEYWKRYTVKGVR